jgi:hypothetical protein
MNLHNIVGETVKEHHDGPQMKCQQMPTNSGLLSRAPACLPSHPTVLSLTPNLKDTGLTQ